MVMSSLSMDDVNLYLWLRLKIMINNRAIGVVISMFMSVCMFMLIAGCSENEMTGNTATREIVSTPLTADSDTGVVTGLVTYSEPISLDPNVVVSVKLLDVSRLDAPSVMVSEQVFENAESLPLEFEIRYDESDIDERAIYSIQVSITDGYRLLFANDSAYDVITYGQPSHVEALVIRVGD